MTDLDTSTDPGTDLHELMDRSLADLDTPTDRLYDGSLRRGRAVRRRRRARAALGGAAVLAAVAAIALPSLTGSRAVEGSVATDSGNPQPSLAEPPPGRWDMPGAVMLHRLEDLLPDNLSVTDADLGDEELAPGEHPSGGWLQVDLLDADGDPAGGLNVVLYPPFDATAAELNDRSTCDVPLDEGTTCIVLRDADGQVLGRTFRSASGDGVVVVREASVVGPEDAELYAAVSNSSDEKWGVDSTVDTATPPMTIPQLRALISDPHWQDWTPPNE